MYTAKSCPGPTQPNKCLLPGCDAGTGNCLLNSLNCDDNNVCTIDSCDPGVGCQHIVFSCDDGNPCTIDGCDPVTNCTHTLISPTCVPCVDVTCNPSDACNNRYCDPINKTCVDSATVCNDNNACTTDSCVLPGGCTFVANPQCNDNNPCTIDSCNSTTGCVYTSVVCNDNNYCTTDSCNSANGMCQYIPIAVPLGDFCTDSFCDPHVGPIKQSISCPSACMGCDPNAGCLNCPGSGFNIPAAVGGISGGIIAAIVIGVIAALIIAGISSKKGYDVWLNHKTNMSGAVTNPMFEDNGLSGVNPLAEDP